MYPTILPLVPCPFWGSTLSPPHNTLLIPCPLFGGGGGVPHLYPIILPLPSREGGRGVLESLFGDTPWPKQDWGTSQTGQVYPPAKTGPGYPPPRTGLRRVYTRESTWYVAGGMPLAFTQGSFLYLPRSTGKEYIIAYLLVNPKVYSSLIAGVYN